MPKWRNEYRKCENCRREYRPQREAQSYCSRNCRRAAAYGRERFQSRTRGRRRRLLTPRLEASERRSIEAYETLPGRVVAGSFRKRGFYSTKSGESHPSRSHISICDSPISAKIYPNSKPEKPSRSCCSQAQRAIGARGNAIYAFSKRETPSLCEDIENDYAQAEREPDWPGICF